MNSPENRALTSDSSIRKKSQEALKKAKSPEEREKIEVVTRKMIRAIKDDDFASKAIELGKELTE